MTTLKLVPRLQNFYHILLRLVTPYHTLSPRLERKPFYVGNFKISSQAPDFLSHLAMPCHSLSHLIIPYPLGWKEKVFHLTALELVPRLQIFYHILSRLVIPYHTLSYLIPRLERKPFMLATLKVVPRLQSFYHILPSLITLYHTLSPRLKRKPFYVGNFKISSQD